MLPVVVGDARAARVDLRGTPWCWSRSSLVPLAFGMGWIYLAGAVAGGALFVYAQHPPRRATRARHTAMANFHASLVQLTLLLVAAIVDRRRCGLSRGARGRWRTRRCELRAALGLPRSRSVRRAPRDRTSPAVRRAAQRSTRTGAQDEPGRDRQPGRRLRAPRSRRPAGAARRLPRQAAGGELRLHRLPPVCPTTTRSLRTRSARRARRSAPAASASSRSASTCRTTRPRRCATSPGGTASTIRTGSSCRRRAAARRARARHRLQYVRTRRRFRPPHAGHDRRRRRQRVPAGLRRRVRAAAAGRPAEGARDRDADAAHEPRGAPRARAHPLHRLRPEERPLPLQDLGDRRRGLVRPLGVTIFAFLWHDRRKRRALERRA